MNIFERLTCWGTLQRYQITHQLIQLKMHDGNNGSWVGLVSKVNLWWLCFDGYTPDKMEAGYHHWGTFQLPLSKVVYITTSSNVITRATAENSLKMHCD